MSNGTYTIAESPMPFSIWLWHIWILTISKNFLTEFSFYTSSLALATFYLYGNTHLFFNWSAFSWDVVILRTSHILLAISKSYFLEISIQVFGPLFNQVICFLAIELLLWANKTFLDIYLFIHSKIIYQEYYVPRVC